MGKAPTCSRTSRGLPAPIPTTIPTSGSGGLDPRHGSEILGLSVERRVLRAWRFGAGGAPPLLVVGGVHGDEPSSVGAVAELGQRLRAGAVAAAGPVWLMPRLNPDGLARGRKNSARDVDLNRNFPAANFARAHDPGYFPGEEPAVGAGDRRAGGADRSRGHRRASSRCTRRSRA